MRAVPVSQRARRCDWVTGCIEDGNEIFPSAPPSPPRAAQTEAGDPVSPQRYLVGHVGVEVAEEELGERLHLLVAVLIAASPPSPR